MKTRGRLIGFVKREQGSHNGSILTPQAISQKVATNARQLEECNIIINAKEGNIAFRLEKAGDPSRVDATAN